MRKFFDIDFLNKSFGEWQVLSRDTKNTKNTSYLCQCSCGAIKSIRADNLFYGKSTKCIECSNIHKCVDDFFETWSPNMAYILGFIFADGNIYKNRLSFWLSSEDKEVLEHISSYISPTSILHIRPPYQSVNKYTAKIVNHKEAVQLQISCKKLVDSLRNLGIQENKTLCSTTLPSIPNQYFYHFFRGLSDGDGSINIRKTSFNKKGKLLKPYIRFNITCNHGSVLEQLREMSTKKGLIYHTNHTSGGSSYQWIISNREDVLEILDKMYYNKESAFWLTRKYDKLQQYIKDTIEYNKQIKDNILFRTNNLSLGLKSCIRCLGIKPLNEFRTNSRNIDKKDNYCKTCSRLMAKQRRDKKKELV